MKIKTSELTGAALDWAVAKCEGINIEIQKSLDGTIFLLNTSDGVYATGYSTAWAQGGPIIEREVHTLIERDGKWMAEVFQPKYPNPNRFCYASSNGQTPLIAAMRCYVASKLGDKIEIPNEIGD